MLLSPNNFREISVTCETCDTSCHADWWIDALKTTVGEPFAFKGMSECYNTNVNVTTAATSGINYVIISEKQHLLF